MPIDTGLVSVPEISQFLAESLVIIRLNMRALRNLRKRRPNAVSSGTLNLTTRYNITHCMIGHIETTLIPTSVWVFQHRLA